MVWEKPVVANLNAMTWHLAGGAEENHEKLQ
jgi:hypothetical protein